MILAPFWNVLVVSEKLGIVRMAARNVSYTEADRIERQELASPKRAIDAGEVLVIRATPARKP